VAPKGQRPNKVIGRKPKGGIVAQRVAIDKLGIHQRCVKDEAHCASNLVDRSQSRDGTGRDAKQAFHILSLAKTDAAAPNRSWQRL
jgi:hypothetical protein